MKKPALNPRKTLERLRSNEAVPGLAADLGVKEAEVLTARDLVRHIGEHQASAAGRLPDPLAQALVEAAVQIEHAEFLKAVAEGGSKTAASFARRGLAILKSKGIDVELEPTGEAVFKGEASKPEELPCLFTTPDAKGERGLWIARGQRGGSIALTIVFYSDAVGVVHAEASDVSRKSFRKLRDELKGWSKDHTFALSEIPLARAKGIVAYARQLSRGGLKLEHETILSPLAGNPADAAPLSKKEPAFDHAVESQRVLEGGDLHDEPEIKTWRPEDLACRALALTLDGITTSALYIDDQQRNAQFDAETLRAADAYFTPEVQKLYAGRIFEVADVLQQEGRKVAAERATATARSLERGVNPVTSPFCKRMFEKLFPKLPELGAPPPPPPTEISPGGLILPGAR